MTPIDLLNGGQSVHEALRDSTRSRHAQVNAIPQMKRLFADDYTLAEYRGHVVRSFGFFEPLEAAAAQVVTADVAAHFVRRTAALRDDLLDLGYASSDIDRFNRCDQLPLLERSGICGYFYVSLGSMLGGVMIARRLRRVLGSRVALRFYSAGSGSGDTRWTAFCTELEHHGADAVAISAAANATFDAYARWMSIATRPNAFA